MRYPNTPNQYYFLIFLFCLFSQVSTAQTDSLQIELSQLDWNDLKAKIDLAVDDKVISGSRSERSIEDLPFTIYVITGEEIRRNGYFTLTDVLKRLPGIRVSQPGSAQLGETFLMRGLQGNSYAKILINDIPLRPFVANGMPIGAQLPIRNAERIEVIYGPAATLYGADASAGVINIIMKKTDRPLYMQAALGFGSDGTENLDVMFNGKIGKGKRILKFSVFGNYTYFNDRQVKYYKNTLYNPDNYVSILELEDLDQTVSPNYKSDGDYAALDQLPHLSRALGVDLYYKRLHFYTHRYYRKDHSSIGLSPLAVSYANPQNFFGESIVATGLSYNLNKSRFRFKASISGLNYKTDPSSSFTYVLPTIGILQYQLALDNAYDQNELDSLINVVNDFLLSDSRYSSAESFEGNLELLFGYKFRKFFELAWGVNTQGGVGNPIRYFLKEAQRSSLENLELESLYTVRNNQYADFSGFVETYFNSKKWNAIIGAQLFIRQNDFDAVEKPLVNPRLAIQYQVTKAHRIRFSASSAFRYPSPFYAATSYDIDLTQLLDITTGAQLEPERTISIDLGTRWVPSKQLNLDASFYYTQTSNFIRYSVDQEEQNFPDVIKVRLGYANDNSARATIYGIQSSLKIKDLIPAIKLNTTFNFNYAIGREQTNSIGFFDTESEELNLNGLRSLPKIITQLDISLKPTDKITLLFENTYLSESLTQNFFAFQGDGTLDGFDQINPGYYTLDALISYDLNKNIACFVKVLNVFNTRYAGIDATDDIDALLFNPQSLRFARVGLTYRLD
ncbi:MAG: TonB-dependent receptor plug domain-containing protein [Saprospiraceae bacterium]